MHVNTTPYLSQSAASSLWVLFPPLDVLSNGAFAVSFFFVISAYVLLKSLEQYKFTLGSALAFLSKRYVRLALPVTAALLFFALVVSIFGHGLDDANALFGTRLGFYTENIKMADLLYQGFVTSIFFMDYTHNPVLWTITMEMLGSVLVLGYWILLNCLCRLGIERWVGAVILSSFVLMLFTTAMISIFMVGIIVYEIKRAKPLTKPVLSVLLIIGAICLLCGGVKGGENNVLSLYGIPAEMSQLRYIVYGWSAGMLVLAFNHLNASGNATRAFMTLGQLSFSLYLLHFSILISFGVWLFKLIPAAFEVKLLVTLPVTFFLTLVLSSCFTRLVDTPTLKLAKQFNNLFVRNNIPHRDQVAEG